MSHRQTTCNFDVLEAFHAKKMSILQMLMKTMQRSNIYHIKKLMAPPS